MQVMRKRIRVYSACRNCVNSISHAQIPHKYILQVSDPELIMVQHMYATYSVTHTMRDAYKFILFVLW